MKSKEELSERFNNLVRQEIHLSILKSQSEAFNFSEKHTENIKRLILANNFDLASELQEGLKKKYYEKVKMDYPG